MQRLNKSGVVGLFPGRLDERQGRFRTTGTSKQASWVALANDIEDFGQPIQADKLPGLFNTKRSLFRGSLR